MAYNHELKKKSLRSITKESFKEAIYVAYRDGITTMAPLGFSGDDILLHGEVSNGRKGVVSIRNYSGDAELLITDMKGNFLFYGRYDIRLGLDFVASEYWKMFILVKKHINKVLPERPEWANVEIAPDCTNTCGFEILKGYMKSKQ